MGSAMSRFKLHETEFAVFRRLVLLLVGLEPLARFVVGRRFDRLDIGFAEEKVIDVAAFVAVGFERVRKGLRRGEAIGDGIDDLAANGLLGNRKEIVLLADVAA